MRKADPKARVLFQHIERFRKDLLERNEPAVEALSWFDFTDHRWLGAPGGVIDDDMNPKPVYHTLHRLIHKEWSPDQTGLTNAEGVTGASLFCGDYEITVEADGLRKTFTRTLPRESFYAGGGSVTWDFAL